jgi:hypothetical protein
MVYMYPHLESKVRCTMIPLSLSFVCVYLFCLLKVLPVMLLPVSRVYDCHGYDVHCG